uniref:Uncharacterized protein n=1 Tax=Ciona intestinalis TaxID=7719 RepID=H2XN16_CIOIN
MQNNLSMSSSQQRQLLNTSIGGMRQPNHMRQSTSNKPPHLPQPTSVHHPLSPHPNLPSPPHTVRRPTNTQHPPTVIHTPPVSSPPNQHMHPLNHLLASQVHPPSNTMATPPPHLPPTMRARVETPETIRQKPANQINDQPINMKQVHWY